MKIICKVFGDDLGRAILSEQIRKDVLQVITGEYGSDYFHQDFNPLFKEYKSMKINLFELNSLINKRMGKWKWFRNILTKSGKL